MTPAQQDALDRLWPRYGIENDTTLVDLDAIFQRAAPRIVEIGFGDGAALAHMATLHPETDHIGIEVHRPGVGRLLRQLEEESIANVRCICADALQVLSDRIAPDSLAGVRLYFPDPWPKKRHAKRRIVSDAFIDLVASRLHSGGTLHMATDWTPYAEHMMAVASACKTLKNRAGDGRYAKRPQWRCETRFERRGRRLDHSVHDLLFDKT